ncbi:MAG: hypothetical protein BWK79_04970 [Beggiatoa sp. IS2]|nr:MAG: hypothetical protein BWK79_04970 [Beggiatoa sp. IS2]
MKLRPDGITKNDKGNGVTEFEGQIWAVQENDDIHLVCVTKQAKNKIQALNEKGRELRLAEDKLLWQYPVRANTPEQWREIAISIQTTVNRLRSVIDVLLLWETALELDISDITDLADLYFSGDITTEHLIALWRVLAEDRLHFKRRGSLWEARTVQQVEELKIQREVEKTRVKELATAKEWLQMVNRQPPLTPLLTEEGKGGMELNEEIRRFVERLEHWLRGEPDKLVEEILAPMVEKDRTNPRELVFEVLQRVGRLPPEADRDVIIAGLRPEFPAAVHEFVQTILPWQPSGEQTITELFFSIDDEETREVDDALAIELEGELWKITIAIADPASVIQRGDVLDREAMRRGTTVYLPTQTVLMLPEKISCDLMSLTVGQVRPSVVITAWLDSQGQLVRSLISRQPIRVLKRLSYYEADALIATGEEETAQSLRQLSAMATQLRAHRLAQGAIMIQRSEFKVSIKDDQTTVTVIDLNSLSRQLVGEMMVLANHIAASYACQHQVPIIYRTQDSPLEAITPEMLAEPLGFIKARKLMRPSTLSLEPAQHSGLGLTAYTQLTSPLRRFADLVMQRQLVAHLVNEPLPYDQDELFKVLATAERTARDSRIFEGDAKKRWFIRYLQQTWQNNPLEVLVIDEAKGGYKVEMQPWGVDAFLGGASKGLELGSRVTAVVDKLRAKTGNIRLKWVAPQ